MSNDDIKKHRDKRNSPEGKLDKNGNPLKYHRDLESDRRGALGLENPSGNLKTSPQTGLKCT